MKLVEVGNRRGIFAQGLTGGVRFHLVPRGAQMFGRHSVSGARRRIPRILIIEHQHLTAYLIGEIVKYVGYSVSGIAHTVSVARQELIERNFDAVLLDIDFGSQHGTELADVLIETGIPFAFLAGSDRRFEPRHISVPLLQKPFKPKQLRTLLEKLVGPTQLGGEVARTG